MVCRLCESKATTIDGRPLEFYEGTKKENGILYLLGPGAYFKDPDPDAGTEYREIWEKGFGLRADVSSFTKVLLVGSGS